MTDDQLDARLREAGTKWRAATVEHTDEFSVRDAAPRRQWWLLASAAVLIAVLVAGAVELSNFGDPARRSGGPSITNVTWHVRSFSAGPNTELIPLTTAATVQFAGDRVKGSDGCNGIDATARISPDTVTIGDRLETQIGCTGADTVDRVLSGTVSYSVTSAALTITKRGVGTLFLTQNAAPSPRTEGLSGTWVLTGTQTTSKDGNSGGGSSVAPTGATNRLTLSVTAFSYSAACLSLHGRVRTDGTVLIFETADDSTFRSCPLSAAAKSISAQNAFVRAVLTGETVWQIDDTQLTITRGTRGLTFEQAK